MRGQLGQDIVVGKVEVGEHIIELLDRLESHLKPRMAAFVFKAYSASRIDGDMLHRLNHAIETIPLFEVQNVRKFNDASEKERLKFDPTSLQAFVNAGLAHVLSGFGALVYQPNNVCAMFLALDLDRIDN